MKRRTAIPRAAAVLTAIVATGCAAALTAEHHQQLAQYQDCGGLGTRTLSSMLKHGASFTDAVGALSVVIRPPRDVALTNSQARALMVVTVYPQEQLPTRSHHSDTVRCLEERHGHKIALPR